VVVGVTVGEFDTPVSQRVVRALAEMTDTDPTDLTPLYGAIDPDSLDRLFDTVERAPNAPFGRVEFFAAGCRVEVSGDGTVEVTRRGGEATTDAVSEARIGAGTEDSGSTTPPGSPN